MVDNTPAFRLSERDFREKVNYCAEWLGVPADVHAFVSLKLRFLGLPPTSRQEPSWEYFDQPDYHLLDVTKISPQLSAREVVGRFRRPATDVDVSRPGDFFEGDGPHDMDTSVSELLLHSGERCLLIRHESGPEIILVLGIVASSVALLKEIVAVIGHLANIHNEKWKRRHARVLKELNDLEAPHKAIEEVFPQDSFERFLSLERRQSERGRLHQEVVLRIPLREVKQREGEILRVIERIVSGGGSPSLGGTDKGPNSYRPSSRPRRASRRSTKR